MMKLSHFDIEEYVQVVQSFHGYTAPGVIIGGFMVNLAKGYLAEETLYNAICETTVCLPDAIQLLTPCTIGNERLRILNLGRFALSLYDKNQGNGFRVFLDPKKIDEWSEIKHWFFKIKPKAEQDMELLLAQIKEAKEILCGIHAIRVRFEFLKKEKRGGIVVCPNCGEAYPARDGEVCRSCQGESPYVLGEPSEAHITTINGTQSHRVY
jgi:formylmethanofuran dehydrogenase subunit E